MVFRHSPRRTVTSSAFDARMRMLQCQRRPIIMGSLYEREGELRCGLHPMTMGIQLKAR